MKVSSVPSTSTTAAANDAVVRSIVQGTPALKAGQPSPAAVPGKPIAKGESGDKSTVRKFLRDFVLRAAKGVPCRRLDGVTGLLGSNLPASRLGPGLRGLRC